MALGATSMNDIALLAHPAQVLGAWPSDTTVRRTLELADPATLDKVARAWAKDPDSGRNSAGSGGLAALCGQPTAPLSQAAGR